ncbi:MAG: ABC transporter ATP-binding protein [Candidatus Heimdallarchaeota archaeon]
MFRGGHMRASLAEEEEEKRPRITSDRKLFSWIISYLGEYKLLVTFGLILVVLGALVDLISPIILSYIIDDVLKSDSVIITIDMLNLREITLYQKHWLLYLTLALLITTLVSALLNIARTITLFKIGYHTVKKIRTDSFAHLQSLSMKYIDNQEAGRLISKVTNDCDKINELMSGGIITSLIDFVTLIGIVVVLLVMNWQLALIVFGLSFPPILLISWSFKRRARKAYRKTRKTIANVTANLSESISGAKVSKSFSREKKNIQDFKSINKENQDANMKATAVFATTFPLFNFIAGLVAGLVYLYGGISINFPGSAFILVTASLGTTIAFTQYVGKFFRPILNLTMFYNTFQSTMAATERVYELNHSARDVQEKEDAYQLKEIAGRVKFDDVVFGYKEDELVLNGFDLNVKAGESIAIVGPTGAGKTTIINLLSRFYEIEKGAIHIDDHNIQDVTLHSLHKNIGIVLQDPYLFSGTIADNISYSLENVPLEDIQEAAKAVNAHEFIERMPKKYDTSVGERGSKLSQGQRQLVSFARALLPNPKILVLDEATSSVDPVTELLIKKALDKLLKGRTSFIVAHRLSTVKNADRIIVLKEGIIIEEGTNDELLKMKGEYFRLYQLQFKDQEETEEVL